MLLQKRPWFHHPLYMNGSAILWDTAVLQGRIPSSWVDQRSSHGRMRSRCWIGSFERDGTCRMRWYTNYEMNARCLSVSQQYHVSFEKTGGQGKSYGRFHSIVARCWDNNIVMRWVNLLLMTLSFWMNLSSMRRLAGDIELMLRSVRKLDMMQMFEEVQPGVL